MWLVLGECGGRLLYHPAGSPKPAKYHLCLTFDDGSLLTETTQMWGAMELFEQGKELERQYIKDMRPTPVDAEFTYAYFTGLIDEVLAVEKKERQGALDSGSAHSRFGEFHRPGYFVSGRAASETLAGRSRQSRTAQAVQRRRSKRSGRRLPNAAGMTSWTSLGTPGNTCACWTTGRPGMRVPSAVARYRKWRIWVEPATIVPGVRPSPGH